PACPDAVHAPLVFLHLLERETERVPQLLLAHCEHLPPHPHSAADVLVNGARSLLAHHSNPARDTHLPLFIRHRRPPIGGSRRCWTEPLAVMAAFAKSWRRH